MNKIVKICVRTNEKDIAKIKATPTATADVKVMVIPVLNAEKSFEFKLPYLFRTLFVSKISVSTE